MDGPVPCPTMPDIDHSAQHAHRCLSSTLYKVEFRIQPAPGAARGVAVDGHDRGPLQPCSRTAGTGGHPHTATADQDPGHRHPLVRYHRRPGVGVRPLGDGLRRPPEAGPGPLRGPAPAGPQAAPRPQLGPDPVEGTERLPPVHGRSAVPSTNKGAERALRKTKLQAREPGPGASPACGDWLRPPASSSGTSSASCLWVQRPRCGSTARPNSMPSKPRSPGRQHRGYMNSCDRTAPRSGTFPVGIHLRPSIDRFARSCNAASISSRPLRTPSNLVLTVAGASKLLRFGAYEVWASSFLIARSEFRSEIIW